MFAGVLDLKIEPFHLTTEQVAIPLPNLPHAFDGYRIVQLTDIHVGPTIARETISRALTLTHDLAPDMIVITGDFITYRLDEAELSDTLSQLDAPDGVWAVLGNHDHWTDPEGVRRVLSQAGVTELGNTSTAIARDNDQLWVAGVDDIWENQHDLSAALEGIPTGAPTILLAHEPDFADEVALDGRVALQLSGHTHGGQISFPVLGRPALSNYLYLGQKYTRGLYKVGDMWLYTSAGIGRSVIPRIFSPPEVTAITLSRAI
jgi:predicted MPP superfamily phosphohydrolase